LSAESPGLSDGTERGILRPPLLLATFFREIIMLGCPFLLAVNFSGARARRWWFDQKTGWHALKHQLAMPTLQMPGLQQCGCLRRGASRSTLTVGVIEHARATNARLSKRLRVDVAVWTLLVLMANLSVSTSTVESAEFSAGAAVVSISPRQPLPVSGGLGIPKPSSERRGDLTARAMVLRSGETTIGIVSLDLLGFPSVLCDRVRQRVTEIPPQNILIGSTHTHSAPDCYAFPDGRGGHTGDLEYIDSVCVKTAEALQAAYRSLQPARLRVATGITEGRIAYNYYAPDLYDRRMSVLQAVSADDKPIVTLVNFAVHPEVLGNDVGIISPDLVGPLCEKLEADVGGIAMFMNGAQGGMITADNRKLDELKDPVRGYWNDARTWDECLRIGQLMASEAQRIVAPAALQTDPVVRCQAMTVSFPVDSPLLWQVILGSPLKYPAQPDRTIRTQVNLLTIGNAQVLTIPGEAMPNIGFYLKRKMTGEHNLLFGLTNDAFGYILTKVDFQSFPRYDYVSRTSLGEYTGEILIEHALRLIEQSSP
jgi:hypothetical protein